MMADDTLATFMERAEEMTAHTAPDLDWRTCWAILASGERRQGAAWARRTLRAWRTWSWARSLEDDARTCRWCAGRLPAGDTRMLYCDTACRNQHWRARKRGEKSPLERLVETAQSKLAELREEATEARTWLDRLRTRGAHLIPPPDLLAFPDLPIPADRCGGGCERPTGCSWTEGGPCLFSRTRGAGQAQPPAAVPRARGPEPTRIPSPPLSR